jgi:hypothetical protein
MKRIALEWGMLMSVGIALTLSTLWVFTNFFDRSNYRLKISGSQIARGNLFLVVNRGDFALSDQYYVPAAGNIRPLILAAPLRTRFGSLRAGRIGGFAIPGVDVRYFRIDSDGYLVWSVRLSLLIPVVLFAFLAAWLHRCLERFWSRSERAWVQASVSGHDARA